MEWGIKKNTEVKKGNGEVGDFLRGRGGFWGEMWILKEIYVGNKVDAMRDTMENTRENYG